MGASGSNQATAHGSATGCAPRDFVGSEEIARKSTAIINACQYSFIFALAPNDIQDLVRLYQNAGGINENEQEQIIQAPRGQAFTILSPSSRSTFQVETNRDITEMFEQPDYQSKYYSSEQGALAWEDYVAESRTIRAENVLDRMQDEVLSDEDPREYRGFVLEEVSEDELDDDGGFSFEEESIPEEIGQSKPTLPPDAPAWVTEDRRIDEMTFACSFLEAYPIFDDQYTLNPEIFYNSFLCGDRTVRMFNQSDILNGFSAIGSVHDIVIR